MKLIKMLSVISILAASNLAQAEMCKNKLFIEPIKKVVYGEEKAVTELAEKVQKALKSKGYNNIVDEEWKSDYIFTLETKTHSYRDGVRSFATATIYQGLPENGYKVSEVIELQDDRDRSSPGDDTPVTFKTEDVQIEQAIGRALHKLTKCDDFKK